MSHLLDDLERTKFLIFQLLARFLNIDIFAAKEDYVSFLESNVLSVLIYLLDYCLLGIVHLLSHVGQDFLYIISNISGLNSIKAFASGVISGSIFAETYTGVESFVSKEGCYSYRGGNYIIIYKFGYRYPTGLVVLYIVIVYTEVVLDILISPLGLLISLRVEGYR